MMSTSGTCVVARGVNTPMHVAILTYGSRGDVQPFIAISVGLRRAGHTVTLAAPAPAPAPFAPLAKRAGRNPFAQARLMVPIRAPSPSMCWAACGQRCRCRLWSFVGYAHRSYPRTATIMADHRRIEMCFHLPLRARCCCARSTIRACRRPSGS